MGSAVSTPAFAPPTADYYWLNADARAFLQEGYLLEGVSPRSHPVP